jgi:hypothetical protein
MNKAVRRKDPMIRINVKGLDGSRMNGLCGAWDAAKRERKRAEGETGGFASRRLPDYLASG